MRQDVQKPIIGILCVRGGSKRLKNKNMQLYGGKPLFQHALEEMGHSKHINRIVFATDNGEMLKLAEKLGYVTTFALSEEFTKPDVSMYESVKQVLIGHPFPIVVILQADNPVESYEIIDKCITVFKNNPDAQDVSTFHNNRRTGTCRVLRKEYFFDTIPTANIYAVDDRYDYVDIHTAVDLQKAENYLVNPHNDTFQVPNKIGRPYKYNTRMIWNHFNRYQQAINHLDIGGRDWVCDASCGMGYGSYLLSLYAEETIGLDVNRDYVKFALNTYSSKDLMFYHYDDFYSKEIQESFDKLVCIETYEHIPKNEINKFVKHILSLIKKGGDLFVTAPLGDNKPSEYNKAHLNEPSFITLYDTFVPRFEQSAFIVDKIHNSYDKTQEYCMCILRGKK